MANPVSQRRQSRNMKRAAWQGNGELWAVPVGLGQRVNHARGVVDIAIVANQQTVLRIELGRGRIGQIARPGNVANVNLKILNFIENRRVIE